MTAAAELHGTDGLRSPEFAASRAARRYLAPLPLTQTALAAHPLSAASPTAALAAEWQAAEATSGKLWKGTFVGIALSAGIWFAAAMILRSAIS